MKTAFLLTVTCLSFIVGDNLFGQDLKAFIFPVNTQIIGFHLPDYERCDATLSEFNSVDSLVNEYITTRSSQLTHNGEPIENYHEYHKQVYGLINEKKEKVLFINCFELNAWHKNWKSETVCVKGGGRQYFNLKVNLENQSVYDFRINAPK